MDEFVNTLPIYTAKRSQDFPAFLIVYCGREDCPGAQAGRPFLVSEREWLRPNRLKSETSGKVTIITGRPCPYCWRSGRLPKRRDIEG